MYPFMPLCVHFHAVFLITVKIYPSTFLLFYMSTDVPVHHYTVLHVHRCTCSSLYLFSLCLIFWRNLPQCPFDSSTGVPTDISTRKGMYLFTIMLFFGVTTNTYLSPQLLVYLPIDVPVHDHTCSFSYSRSTRPRFCCTTFPQTYLFINIPVRFISYFSAYPTQ